ncbi:MAG: hypothetical protein QXM75_03710 [Candidatus Diapherotrites archaeon]
MMLKADDFTKSSCKGENAFAFIPKKKLTLDLKKIRKGLEEKGAKVIAETPFLLMIRFRSAGVSLFKSGKVIVKGLNEKDCENVFIQILEFMG